MKLNIDIPANRLIILFVLCNILNNTNIGEADEPDLPTHGKNIYESSIN